jgi:ketosteroid isomerase-like protein
MSGSDRNLSLADRSAIRDLALRYCTAVDRRDWDLLAELFLPDATVDVQRSNLMRGTDEIVARYRRGLSRYDATHHMVTNHEIAVDGDSARHSCLVHAQHMRPDAAGSTIFTIGGRYEDQLVRTPQGWRFKHRELVTIWSEGDST